AAACLFVSSSAQRASDTRLKAPAPDVAQERAALSNYGKLPLSFERNAGQVSKDVRFLARGPGFSLYLTERDALLALRPSSNREATAGSNPATLPNQLLRMTLVGAKK